MRGNEGQRGAGVQTGEDRVTEEQREPVEIKIYTWKSINPIFALALIFTHFQLRSEPIL